MRVGLERIGRRLRVGRLVSTALCAVVVLCGCSQAGHDPNASTMARAGAKALTAQEVGALARPVGRTVYVPVYSHIYHGNDLTIDLTATLSIRNTDPDHSIVIASARYYDTAGRLIRDYVATPLLLPPLASLDYVVGMSDAAGGAGANFLVAWSAEQPAAAPIIECVMIGTSGQQGISFVSVGRPIR